MEDSEIEMDLFGWIKARGDLCEIWGRFLNSILNLFV